MALVAVFAAVFLLLLPLPLPAARLVELDELFDLLLVGLFEEEVFAVDLPDEVLEDFADELLAEELPDFAPDDFEPVERPPDDFALDERRSADEDLEPDELPDVFDFAEPEDLFLELEDELPDLLRDEPPVVFPAELLVDRFPELVFLPEEDPDELVRNVPPLPPFPVVPGPVTCSKVFQKKRCSR